MKGRADGGEEGDLSQTGDSFYIRKTTHDSHILPLLLHFPQRGGHTFCIPLRKGEINLLAVSVSPKAIS